MNAGFVTVFQTDDPLQAEMLTDLLKQEGLDARLIGTRYGAAIGVAQHVMRLKIEVPSTQVGDAVRLIEAWEQEPPADAPVGDDERPGEDAPEPASSSKLSPLLAAGCALIPGGSHFYTRRAWTGAVLAAGFFVAIFTVFAGDRGEASVAAITIVGIFVFDVALGQLAVRAFNGGRRRSAYLQLLVGAGALFVSGAIGAIVSPHLPKRPPLARIVAVPAVAAVVAE